jgi:hypothetical protein
MLLKLTGMTMRVAIDGYPDAVEFYETHEGWVSELGERVKIEYMWMRDSEQPRTSVEDCICSRELASKLISLLIDGEK